ncbi:MFS transporter [Actinosynnema sp. CA-299493]
MDVPVPPPTRGAGHRRPGRRVLLFALSGTMLVDTLEVSLLVIALPTIRSAFDLTHATALLVPAAFATGFAALLAPGLSIVERVGLRRTYLGAVFTFGLALVVGGAAPNVEVLVLAELVKGACAALSAPAGMMILSAASTAGGDALRTTFVYSLAGSAGAAGGMLVSGALTETSWRLALLVPLPVVLALGIAALATVPNDGASAAPAPKPRFTITAPLLRACLGAATLNGASLGFVVVVNFQLQDGLRWSSLHAALVCTPAFATLMLSAWYAKPMVERWGTARLITTGAAVAAATCALYLWRPDPGSWGLGVLLPALAIGIAYLCSFAPLNVQAARETSANHPAAKSLLQTSVQVSTVVFLPLAGVLLDVGGHRTALVLVTCLGVVGVVVASTDRARRVAP